MNNLLSVYLQNVYIIYIKIDIIYERHILNLLSKFVADLQFHTNLVIRAPFCTSKPLKSLMQNSFFSFLKELFVNRL